MVSSGLVRKKASSLSASCALFMRLPPFFPLLFAILLDFLSFQSINVRAKLHIFIKLPKENARKILP
jgi:hypothetical protein